jgi:hypothetical protein
MTWFIGAWLVGAFLAWAFVHGGQLKQVDSGDEE